MSDSRVQVVTDEESKATANTGIIYTQHHYFKVHHSLIKADMHMYFSTEHLQLDLYPTNPECTWTAAR